MLAVIMSTWGDDFGRALKNIVSIETKCIALYTIRRRNLHTLVQITEIFLTRQ